MILDYASSKLLMELDVNESRSRLYRKKYGDKFVGVYAHRFLINHAVPTNINPLVVRGVDMFKKEISFFCYEHMPWTEHFIDDVNKMTYSGSFTNNEKKSIYECRQIGLCTIIYEQISIDFLSPVGEIFATIDEQLKIKLI